MKENSFKKTEKTLYDYKDLNVNIENIDLEIEILMNDVSCAGVSYEYKGGPTNSFSSSVENEVIKRDEYLMSTIEGLKKMKNKTIILRQKINNALSTLKKEDHKLVELRYFDKEGHSWIEIGMNLGVDKVTCHRIKNRVINKLADSIYPRS